jgi:uncharacterized protein YqjF (DUF2071 family)
MITGRHAPTVARFADAPTTFPPPTLLGLRSTLHHFAIVTYAVPPERLMNHVDPAFRLDTAWVDHGERALVSVVPFLNTEFRSSRLWSPSLSFGQTNYRVYVIERATGRRGVWFLGTTLHSATVWVPRLLWGMPWHYGELDFDCELARGTYRTYCLRTESEVAPVELSLASRGETAVSLPGFEDDETSLVVLTHPLEGYFRRRDGHVGRYSVWHERLELHHAEVETARFGWLDALGIVPFEEQLTPHSVLLQPRTDFWVHLPPRRYEPPREAPGA